jgi:hypothetical protein
LLLDGANVAHDGHGARRGICTGIIGVEAFDVGEEEKVVGVNYGGRDGGEGVVVAKLDFLFISG